MIRAVIFDIGGVLVRTEDLEPRRVWERRLGLPDWGLAKIVFSNETAARATVGQATINDVWETACQRLGLSAEDLAQLKEDFWAGDHYDHDLFAFLSALRPRHKTGIISNAWPGVREFHARYINDATFDVIVYSQEEGIAKPAPEIYQRALTRLAVRPEEAVFVDDVLENVEAAQALGMAGVRFESAAQTKAALEKLLAV
jgi:epoxide hydrolase-like predicted phosphatase